MQEDDITEEIGALLRGLRSCDTQATAVAWMARAYKVMERSLQQMARSEQTRFVFVPERPKLEVVRLVPKFDVRYAQARQTELHERSHNQTVVYPHTFRHPGLKPLPKPWTHEDTLRLERAAKKTAPMIQRLGR